MLNKIMRLFVMVFLAVLWSAAEVSATTTYVVGTHDSRYGLSGIAQRFCGNANLYVRIAVANKLTNPDLIKPGQILTIPCGLDSTKAQARTLVARVSTTYGIRTISNNTYDSKNAIVEAIREYFPEEGALPIQVFVGESGLNLRAKGYNCYYRVGGQVRSSACRERDRGRAWSVDCGLTQINVRGQQCPEYLYSLHGNLAAARQKYEERGNTFCAWVVYQKMRGGCSGQFSRRVEPRHRNRIKPEEGLERFELEDDSDQREHFQLEEHQESERFLLESRQLPAIEHNNTKAHPHGGAFSDSIYYFLTLL